MTDVQDEKARTFYNKYIDVPIHDILKNEIKLNKKDIKIRTGIMNHVVRLLQQKSAKLDPMLERNEIFYGGSYFCGTKIKLPDEFDLDIFIKLPFQTRLIPNKSGYLAIQVENFDEEMFGGKYRTFASFLDKQNYILPHKVQDWYKGIIQKSLNNFIGSSGYNVFSNYGLLSVKMSQSGPAVTIHIYAERLQINIDVDMVISFKFPISTWVDHYPVQSKGKIGEGQEFFVIPKPPKNEEIDHKERLWTPSFQQIENKLLFDMYYLKPSIRLLKFLRDQWNHKSIKSYFIKTLVMNMLASGDYPDEFWKRNSLSYVFMRVLKYYSICLEKGHLYSFWNNKKDLFENIAKIEIYNMSQKIKRIIHAIDNKDEERGKEILNTCFALKASSG